MWIHDAHAEGSQSLVVFDIGSGRAEGRVEGGRGRGDSGWGKRGIGGKEMESMEICGLLAGGGFMGLRDSGK